MESNINGSDKNVGSIERIIEELTKVRPHELSKDGLKLFEYINEIIDRNKELEEENKIIKGNYYTLCADIQMVTSELGFPEDTIIADEMISKIKENYIPVSLVEEKRTKLKDQYNRVVNEINNQGMIDQLIDFKEVSAKLEMCEELLEKRKSKC